MDKLSESEKCSTLIFKLNKFLEGHLNASVGLNCSMTSLGKRDKNRDHCLTDVERSRIDIIVRIVIRTVEGQQEDLNWSWEHSGRESFSEIEQDQINSSNRKKDGKKQELIRPFSTRNPLNSEKGESRWIGEMKKRLGKSPRRSQLKEDWMKKIRSRLDEWSNCFLLRLDNECMYVFDTRTQRV